MKNLKNGSKVSISGRRERKLALFLSRAFYEPGEAMLDSHILFWTILAVKIGKNILHLPIRNN